MRRATAQHHNGKGTPPRCTRAGRRDGAGARFSMLPRPRNASGRSGKRRRRAGRKRPAHPTGGKRCRIARWPQHEHVGAQTWGGWGDRDQRRIERVGQAPSAGGMDFFGAAFSVATGLQLCDRMGFCGLADARWRRSGSDAMQRLAQVADFVQRRAHQCVEPHHQQEQSVEWDGAAQHEGANHTQLRCAPGRRLARFVVATQVPGMERRCGLQDLRARPCGFKLPRQGDADAGAATAPSPGPQPRSLPWTSPAHGRPATRPRAPRP